MNKERSRIVRSSLMVTGVIAAAVIGLAKDDPGFVRITPADIHWQEIPDSHGVQQAVLLGDPAKPGLYVVRIRFPPHIMDVPHWHPNARYVTVLEGTWYAGTGNTFDRSRAVPLKAGSVMLHPAKAVHWDGAGGDEPVVVQIIGEGPGTTTPLDEKAAFWMDVSH